MHLPSLVALFLLVAEESVFNHPLDLLMHLLFVVKEMGHGPYNKGQTMWRWSRMKSNSILQTDCSKLTLQG